MNKLKQQTNSILLHFLIQCKMNLILFLEFSLTIMVNRGWIPRCDHSIYKMGNKIIDPVEITGIIRITEKRPPFVPNNTPAKGVWHYR